MSVKVARVPGATYRLQFNQQFRFSDAIAILDYLQALGISDIYTSPLFLAGPESTHGYDVCEFNTINPSLGSRADFDEFTAKIREKDMGLLLDMVPNHMGSAPANCWWYDVLKNGRESRFATWFDIDWDAQDGKVLLPVLGDRYGNVLRRRELRLVSEGGELLLAYFSARFPVNGTLDPGSLEEINQDIERLHAIIQRQHYRPAFWRLGSHELNYRKFFDVTSLVSIRVENPEVFDAAHQLVFTLLKAGTITGLRIDHPDGLHDPKSYFDRLQRDGAVFVVAEKILSEDERLPRDWAVNGTTGYDYLNVANGLFIARDHEANFDNIYREFGCDDKDYAQLAREAKEFVLKELFGSELTALSKRFKRLSQNSIDGADFSLSECKEALTEYIAEFPVYRTYARQNSDRIAPEEGSYVSNTIARASKRLPAFQSLFEYLRRVLCLEISNAEAKEFVFRLQQLTGPATAKGLEDTAFYRYARFVSLNEVGGNPGRFGLWVDEFHRYNEHKQQNWPNSLLASSTHDTKRGEDMRARLNVLSELPAEWKERVLEWRELNRAKRSCNAAPSAKDEYLLYQTLVGCWTGEADDFVERIQQYMEKTTREAKLETSWLNPSEEYEAATKKFVSDVLGCREFTKSLSEFVERIGYFGVFNSLSQVLLKICSPGVPDFYQGTELWDFNLVDPDNRRPVNYRSRGELLESIKRKSVADLLESPEGGEIKLFTVYKALHFRRDNKELFQHGSYLPMKVTGSRRDHVVAFAREWNGRRAVVVVPRLTFLLARGEKRRPLGREIWSDTSLESDGATYTNVFTGQSLGSFSSIGDILADFPVALLSRN